jgi:hypothetical protein
MTRQITLEQVLQLVDFEYAEYSTHPSKWRVSSVLGDVWGDVHGAVWGEINGRKWYFAETHKEKLQRLVKEGATKEELLAAINQLEND